MSYLFLMKPPASFLQAMEEYVREAPRGSTFRKDQVWNCSLLNLICFGSNDIINKHICALKFNNRKVKELQISLTL